MSTVDALILQSDLIGISQELKKIRLLLSGPPADATCGTCRWYKDGNGPPGRSGRCKADGMKYAGEIETGNDWWFFPPMDKSDLCRHWRAKP